MAKHEVGPADPHDDRKYRAPYRQVTEAVVAKYLERLALTGKKNQSARDAGVSPNTIQELRKKNKEFAAREAEALDDVGESLEDVARGRAVEGWDEPVFYKGEECGSVRKFSDALLLALLKANVAKFRERAPVEATMHGGVLVVMAPARTAEEWAESDRGTDPA